MTEGKNLSETCGVCTAPVQSTHIALVIIAALRDGNAANAGTLGHIERYHIDSDMLM